MIGVLQGLFLVIGVDQGLLAFPIRAGLHLHLLGVDQGVLPLVLLQLGFGLLVVVLVVQAREVEHSLALSEHLALLDGRGQAPARKQEELVRYAHHQPIIIII